MSVVLDLVNLQWHVLQGGKMHRRQTFSYEKKYILYNRDSTLVKREGV